MNFISTHIQKLLQEVGIDTSAGFGVPPDASMGDVAFPCFEIAKKEGVNPAEVAKTCAEKLSSIDHELVADVSAAGPYVNLTLNPGAVASLVLPEIGENYGALSDGIGKKVLIEYPSQNTHKEFHIGHLRNVCIGNALVGLYKKTGYDITPVNYINDFGAHVVKCLWGILNLYDGIVPETDVQKWLGKVYAEANAQLTDRPELKSELDELQLKLENRDEEIWGLFEHTRDASLDGFAALAKELGVAHDHVFLESEVKDRGQEKVDELLSKGIAQEGFKEKGSKYAPVIVNLSTENEHNVALLRKSSGAGLYMTSDLALAEKKFEKYDVHESINITGIEQNFYFKQLYRVLALSGFDKQLTHIGYGLVTLPSGKMSSRKGNVILYEDLRNTVFDKMRSETVMRHEDWDDEQIDAVASTLTQAVLKFSMQQHEAKKNMVFDMDEATSVEGYSAPYVLYAIARMNSIERKAEETTGSTTALSLLTEPEEKQLIMTLATYGEVVSDAKSSYNPAIITRFAFGIAKQFNDFYHKHSILDAGSDDLIAARLQLVQAAKLVLTDALSVLSIETVDEM